MVTKKAYVPGRGDVVWVDLDPTKGHEQSGKRPAVVLSPQPYNRATGLAIMCPLTSQVKGYPFEVPVRAGKIDGVALVDHVRSLDWKVRHTKKISALSEEALHEMQTKLKLLLL